MAVKIIGKCAYEFEDGTQRGCGGFYLTTEIRQKLEMLELEAEELINRASYSRSLLPGKSHVEEIGSRHKHEMKKGGSILPPCCFVSPQAS